MLLRHSPTLRCRWWETEGIAPCQIVVTTWCSICGGDVQMWLVQMCSDKKIDILREDGEKSLLLQTATFWRGRRPPEHTASSIYWAPPSARFVTISARCDCWRRRRAITQFALALHVAKLFPRALCKAVAPITTRQHRQITDLVRCITQSAAVGSLEMVRWVMFCHQRHAFSF
jgi:hypothetical protein